MFSAVPIPLLPLTNTFPAMGILLFAPGRLEGDGVLTVIASAALGLTIVIFGAVGFAASLLGVEAVRSLLPFDRDVTGVRRTTPNRRT